MRLFLFPALGADERMFSFLGKLPVDLALPRLSSPLPEDSMSSYASRIAGEQKIGDEDWIGGCSFGGMVASEIARQRNVAGLILISSGLSSAAVDPVAHRLGDHARFLPTKIMRSILGSDVTFKRIFGKDQPPLYELARKMLKETADELLIHGGRLSLSYHPKTPVKCPVFAIHGENDTIMFPVEFKNCRLVQGAGQGMVVTHPGEVTAFLNEVLSQPD